MDNLLKSPVLYVSEEQLNNLRLQFEISDEKKFEDDILVIREWLKKESHLVEAGEYLNDNIIRRMYFHSKGSIEGTKDRIDKFCTARGLAPELCLKRTANEFNNIYNKIHYLIPSSVNPKDNCRVTITRFLTPDLDDVNFTILIRYFVRTLDYIINVDYNFGTRSIIDYRNFPLSFFFKINPMLVRKLENLCTKAYCLKVKGIHMVNVPNFFDKVLLLFKQSMSEKIVGRIHVHSNYEELHEHISKEILPEEYGGDGPSCEVLSDKWKQTLESEDGGNIIENIENVVADETKRSSCKFNEEYLGMPGSFKALNVD